MDRWTMRELKETDDITFAICILNERRRGLTPYSPLGMKLSEAAHTLSEIKAEHGEENAAEGGQPASSHQFFNQFLTQINA